MCSYANIQDLPGFLEWTTMMAILRRDAVDVKAAILSLAATVPMYSLTTLDNRLGPTFGTDWRIVSTPVSLIGMSALSDKKLLFYVTMSNEFVNLVEWADSIVWIQARFVHHLVLSEISQETLDGLPRNAVQLLAAMNFNHVKIEFVQKSNTNYRT